MVQVRWRDEFGKDHRETALLEDISPSSACLQLEHPVAVGTVLRWECPNQRFIGTVRRCSFHEIGYFAGIRLSPETPWSRTAYQPPHLLDLEDLIERSEPGTEK